MATLQEGVIPQRVSLRPNTAGSGRSARWRWFVILLLVWLVSGIYEASHLKRGWVPWDAGAYAESAVRVLHGQLPHRDFVDVYTGGLSYLNAAAMRIFGENLTAERIIFFPFFLAWIPALYWVAARFCKDWLVGSLVLLAVVWSVPNYSEAVPSWYNLFFATFGIATLLAYLERPSWRWLFLAGICGGVSFLAKSVGLCFVAGVLLFLLFREQSETRENAALARLEQASLLRPRLPLYSIFLFVSLAVFLTLLIRLVLPFRVSGMSSFAEELILFVLPSVAISCVLFTNELRMQPSGKSLRRFSELVRMCLPFGIGVILPILVFLVPYFRAHAMGALMRDLFTQASTRIAAAYKFPDVLATIIPAIFLALVVWLDARLRGRARWILLVCVTGLFACGFIFSFTTYEGYVALWSAAYWLPPILVILGSGVFLSKTRRGASTGDQKLFLLLSVTALCTLVEFPYSAPVYFCYVAPLAILVIAALLQRVTRASRDMLAMLYIGFFAFAVFAVTPGFIYVMGFRYHSNIQTARVNLPRAGSLLVDPDSAATYERLISLIRAHAGSGEIYAAPDCPEVYFLSGYRNLTPDIYDFLDPPADQPERVLQLISDPRIRVVVLNDKPWLSPPFSDALHRSIAQLFPTSVTVVNFEVRWR
jgi:hypothetical protein